MHVEKADDDISLIFDGILVVVIFLFANISLSKSSLFWFVLPESIGRTNFIGTFFLNNKIIRIYIFLRYKKTINPSHWY